MSDCEGEGSGWGTIAGVRLRVLVLAGGGEDDADARRLSAALGRGHEVKLVDARGILAPVQAAAAARALAPHIVHAVGVEGAAKSAHAIAAGVGALLVASLRQKDLETGSRVRALARAGDASALLTDEGATADHLRGAGIARDIYVVACPEGHDEREERAVLEAIEVVYGRMIGALRPELARRDDKEKPLVQIGAKKS